MNSPNYPHIITSKNWREVRPTKQKPNSSLSLFVWIWFFGRFHFPFLPISYFFIHPFLFPSHLHKFLYFTAIAFQQSVITTTPEEKRKWQFPLEKSKYSWKGVTLTYLVWIFTVLSWLPCSFDVLIEKGLLEIDWEGWFLDMITDSIHDFDCRGQNTGLAFIVA